MEENKITEEVKVEEAKEAAPAEKRPARAPRGNRPVRGGARKPFVKPEKEFEEKVVQINRISKTVKGGRKMRFAALVVVGDKKGRVGYGMGKANEVPDAIRKASEAAKKNVVRVSLVNDNKTIPHPVTGVYGAGQVVLRPAAEGTGVIAGGAIRSVLELAGLTDVVSKCVGSRTPINAVRATMAGLTSLRTVQAVSKIRGKQIKDIR